MLPGIFRQLASATAIEANSTTDLNAGGGASHLDKAWAVLRARIILRR